MISVKNLALTFAHYLDSRFLHQFTFDTYIQVPFLQRQLQAG